MAEKVPEEVRMIQLEYGSYMFDRFEGGEIAPRVDLETLEPLFNYPVKEDEEPSRQRSR
ncbi:hypothetical protein [Paenibacillus amylolyticus]|uniref:hypothetical protein n=1 Tax=Paenibacillus amylolyticus TaxID=1451 RepID=UPI00339A8EB7